MRDPIEPALARLRAAFSDAVEAQPLVDPDRMGRRLRGIDLTEPLDSEQARAVIGALDDWQVISLPDQHDLTVHQFERFANHFGAPIPHPSNVVDYLGDTARLKPPEQGPAAEVAAAFPGQIALRPGGASAAVYLVTNLIGAGPEATPKVAGGQHWHTDIEFEPVPLSTSMFLVDQVPTRRNGTGTWVTNPGNGPGFYHPDSAELLTQRRQKLPLNGETAFADTAAAYRALDDEHQRMLDTVMIRRRRRKDDDGFVIPLVYVNPRNEMKSLHSPVWASRGKRIAPAQVEGMTPDESRRFLDDLEAHCLAPSFRYDHPHRPGDVTIWSNFSTLHVAPPTKTFVNDPDDARLMYRISCKGPVATELPRCDSEDWVRANITPPYRSPTLG